MSLGYAFMLSICQLTIQADTQLCTLVTLTTGLKVHVEKAGTQSEKLPIVFVHGLGGSSTNYGPVIQTSGLTREREVITFDLEGHGLSPLSGGNISIEGFADSIALILQSAKIDKAVIVGHSMGGIIVTTLAAKYPAIVDKLILIGPVKAFPEAGVKALTARAASVREQGMSGIADTVVAAGTSQITQSSRPLAKYAVRASLLTTPAEAYALACLALTKAADPDYSLITMPVLILAGTEDKTCPEATVIFLSEKMPQAKVVTFENVGHWHLFEEVEGVSREIAAFA
ncbi:hypothetical protein SERLA73DRAFT_156032 [Serpula lacrymans var. lacrymans S7.3]|uniref:Serine aminopeptidase S33 domain-containing protein n=2 Tax=Serpula lacrymans var. lacrymans TaxID=341189 RepID=F8QCM2_SERL3|nr:uncharacterized protein SERLADRAFT_411758 [Serpula lacrymans var. lacrymans S7.9]EGN93887.1 hypothetical protein SERLA73DRAFT_156032 [Serpula lacrymans var. lacrymans S7.3]EGO19252.1 hypothetical protein SERLADRAFT_411758 [Serpula lacrymans var. lacrymans S7.9]